ncbi:gamma-glutamyltransferase [Streptomyces sp. NPDC056231]|uniref:gamma-glutamyltransferase n=1 Tax=Streptomyces sp. NPDC056231 TaxID=3345755 RepID=UPI003AB0F9E3
MDAAAATGCAIAADTLSTCHGPGDRDRRADRIHGRTVGRHHRYARGRYGGWSGQGPSEVLARNGVVATIQPLAAQAGLRILQQGGNSVDAAVAKAAVLGLTEPGNAGIDGDTCSPCTTTRSKRYAPRRSP